MRGGSRSGMACAFIRFSTQAQAQAAIDAIHGRVTLPDTAEPLVVRWADAPGSRRREGREGGRGKRNGGGGGGGARNGEPLGGGMEGWGGGGQMILGPNGTVYGAPYHPGMMMGNLGPQGQMLPPQALMAPQVQMGGQFAAPPYFGHGMPGASFANGTHGGIPPQHMGGGNPYAQQQMMMFMQEVRSSARARRPTGFLRSSSAPPTACCMRPLCVPMADGLLDLHTSPSHLVTTVAGSPPVSRSR